MARRPRTVAPGVPLHVTQRGINRMAIFFAEEDYRVFLRGLRWAGEQQGCAIHAYVLMTNHVHLLLTPRERDGPACFMRSLGALYVGYVNKRYARTGALWERRYRSALVDSPRYLLACMRYVELNPLRARLVSDLSQYRWSSYHRNALGKADPLVTPHDVYNALGSSDIARCSSHRNLLEAQEDPCDLDEVRAATHRNAAVR